MKCDSPAHMCVDYVTIQAEVDLLAGNLIECSLVISFLARLLRGGGPVSCAQLIVNLSLFRPVFPTDHGGI
jgi:hypothetical protein